jgi:hypothetical protein
MRAHAPSECIMDQINEDADGTNATEVQPRKTRVISEARILQNRISAQKSTEPRACWKSSIVCECAQAQALHRASQARARGVHAL